LAQQLGADLRDRHPGGTWWIELAPAVTPEAVLVATATFSRSTVVIRCRGSKS
jgi:hypothetical protein